ncbi:MAG TPA: aldo/keto reductase [Gemmatimonadaceae bacterium]|nr:aldo/keto reductase [Gemmatimonadaceae bacterium]
MTSSTKSPNAANAGTVSFGDLTVNRLGFGAMRITGDGIWGEPKDPAEAKRVLERAVELGVTLIDTADSYGPEVSERLIGNTLAPYKKGLVIATKGGYTRSGPNQWKPNLQPKHLREALEGSLKRLKLERIDVYQLHNAADQSVKLADAIGELAIMQSEGKIRHIGVSNFSVAQLSEARSIVSVVSVQNRYNLGDRASEAVLKECEKLNIPFLPWAPLGKSNSAATAALESVAKAHGATTGQIAIAALLAHSPMMLPIPGTSRVAHLEENIAAAGIELTSKEQKELSLTA